MEVNARGRLQIVILKPPTYLQWSICRQRANVKRDFLLATYSKIMDNLALSSPLVSLLISVDHPSFLDIDTLLLCFSYSLSPAPNSMLYGTQS